MMTTLATFSGAYGEQMASYFGVDGAESLVIGAPEKQPVAITRLVSGVGLPDRTDSIPPEKAFLISVHLTPASPRGFDIWIDDKHSRVPSWPAGGVGIYDLESNPQKCNPSPIDWVHYYVPRSTLDRFTDDAGQPRIESFPWSYGIVDPTLEEMTRLILPALRNPQAFCQLFLEHFRLLFCAHLSKKSNPSFETRRFRGGLAPWQKKRVTELFREHLDGTLRLATLAGACGLSVSHFARSFRRTFGTSAHHYLILQRIDRSKTLLKESVLSLPEVAFQSGFSDQAALSRTFKAVVGCPPGQWQREITHCHTHRDHTECTPKF